MIESVFILLLLIFSNFSSSTLPIGMRTYMSNNIIRQQILVLLLTYFSVANWKKEHYNNVYSKIKYTLVIWIVYLLLIKCNTIIITMCIGILFILYFLNDCKGHVSTYENEYGITVEHIDITITYTEYTFGIILLYGLFTSTYTFKKNNNLLENLLSHK